MHTHARALATFLEHNHGNKTVINVPCSPCRTQTGMQVLCHPSARQALHILSPD